MTNYYTILRVTENASTDEIKAAYRALAKEYHPDVNPNNSIAEEYFKQVNEAYAVLKDPIKRNWYNLLLKGNFVTRNTDPRKYGTRKYYNPNNQNQRQEAEEESKTPFWLRQMVPLLSMLWCLLLIYNNWFMSYQGNEPVKIVFAFLLLSVSAYFYINNLYNRWRTKGTSFNPENRSLRYFLLIFFLTLPAFFAIGIARKNIQLNIYPAVTQGTVIEYKQRLDQNWISVLYFDENNMPFSKEFTFESSLPLKRSDFKVSIKYSKLEPRIAQFHLQLLRMPDNLQQKLDTDNEGGSYFLLE